MDDYYRIVGVDRNASTKEIEAAVRKQLRMWQRRASSADLVRRQEAERRVQQLSEARAVLADDQRRRRYDRELDASRTPPPPPPPPSPPPPPPPLPPPPPPNRVVYPIPPPPPVPLKPHFHSYRFPAAVVREPSLTYRHAPGADISLAVAPAFLFAGIALDISQPLGTFVVMLGVGAAVVAGVFWYLSSRVVLSPRGIALYQPTARTFPWAQVHAIELTEVAGVRRAGLLTVDGGRILLPAPRSKRLIGRNGRFLVELAEMQRWHQHYAPR